MKGIKEWVKDLEADEELAKKFENIEDAKEVVKLAKDLGYEFTEDELMDLKMEAVSGGGNIIMALVKGGCKFANIMDNLIGNGLEKIGEKLSKKKKR